MKLDFSQKYAVRPLTAGDVDKILALCAENEQFYRYHPPLATKESVLEDLSALPPGKNAADKHYLGFFDGKTLVAVLDLILDYPQEGTAYLGFFMTKKATQGRGIGSANCWTNCARRAAKKCALPSTGAIRRARRSGRRTALR